MKEATKYLMYDEVMDCCQLIGFRTSMTSYKGVSSIHGATEEDLKTCTVFTRKDFERHAAWLTNKETSRVQCARCLCWQEHKSTYCPECGTKMDVPEGETFTEFLARKEAEKEAEQ